MRTIKSIIHTCLLASALLNASNVVAETTDVEVFHPQTSAQSQQLVLTGTIEAINHAELAPLQAGVVAELFVEVGDKVDKNQKLLALDAKLAELSLVQKQSELSAAKLAKDEAERLLQEVKALSQKQLVAETLMAERQSSVAIAIAELSRVEAELAHQQEVLARHNLYAPFSGVIAERNVDAGEWVTQQTKVYTLVQQNDLRLNVSIPQEYFGRLQADKDIAVTVIPDFDHATTIQAQLTRVVAVAKNNSRTFTGLVKLPNSDELIAGMSARAIITLPNSKNPIVWLPKSAIKQHPDGGRSVFAVVDEKAKRYLVTIKQQQDNRVAVSGVPANMPIVTSGVELLRNNMSLNITAVKGRQQ